MHGLLELKNQHSVNFTYILCHCHHVQKFCTVTHVSSNRERTSCGYACISQHNINDTNNIHTCANLCWPTIHKGVLQTLLILYNFIISSIFMCLITATPYSHYQHQLLFTILHYMWKSANTII